jgi:tyrosyl-tRNA synthetase
MQNVIKVLKERGLLDAVTDPRIEQMVEKPIVVYAGFDPSSDSLQLGNLVAVIGLAHFQRCGHRVVALLGGATGLIGDPSGKTREREAADAEQIARNVAGIRENLSRILDRDSHGASIKVVNNADWIRNLSTLDFLRDVGRHFRVGAMLGKESVKARLESEAGLNYAEFSYQLLQSYDFLHLFEAEQCVIQVGGSDQWGNITAGIDLIHKTRNAEAFGVTFPLVCDSTGAKFGKSEGNAVYLDSRKTSCYEFYQALIRTADADTAKLLRILTFLPLEEIAELEKQIRAAPEKRAAQQRLAEEVTRLVHGERGLTMAQRASSVLFGGSFEGLTSGELLEIFANVPSKELPRSEVMDATAVDVAVRSGFCASKGEARRLVESGGLYVNNQRVRDVSAKLGAADAVDGRIVVMRSGKKNFFLVKIS